MSQAFRVLGTSCVSSLRRSAAKPIPAYGQSSFLSINHRHLSSSSIACKPPIPKGHPSHASVKSVPISSSSNTRSRSRCKFIHTMDSCRAPFLFLPTHSPDMEQDYPHVKEREDLGWGHQTTGAGIGKHTKRTLGSLSMDGKVCVVTGAARGLGNLFARTLAESGSNAIVLLDLDEDLAEHAAEDLVQHMIEHGEAKDGEVEAIGLGLDVSNEDKVKQTFKKIIDKFGRIDVLVTAAGIVHNYEAINYPTDKMQQLYNINVNGSFFCARETAKYMIESNLPASIVLIGSMSGSTINVPQPQTPYNASKAAVKHMAASLGVEWAKKGVRVNCISPGYMATSLTQHILANAPDLKATWENLTPMGRIGNPEDLKGALIYLASDASAFTTGSDLRVDGGYCLT